MWLPVPLYESMPYLSMIGGVLMISGARYIGFDTTTAPLYVATGLMSIVYGLYIIALRTTYRRDGEDLKNTWHA